MIRRPLSTVFIRFLGPLLLGLVTALSAGAEEERLSDPENKWSYGIAEFRVEADSPVADSLGWRLPLLLAEKLRGCPLHHYSREERLSRARRVKQERIEEKAAEITSLSRRLDESFFASGGSGNTDSLEKKRRQRRGRLEELRAMPAESVEVPANKPCVYSRGEGPAGLYRWPRVPAWVPLRDTGLDYLITGSIEEVEEIFFLEIYGYHTDSRMRRLLYRGNFLVGGMEETVSRASSSVREAIYGREWADLQVRTSPPSAEVVLQTAEGRRKADGTRYRYLPPGEVELTVSAPGYRRKRSSYQLLPGERRRVTVELEAEKKAELRLRTFPQGTEVFFGSRRVGEAPLTVEDAVLPATLTLRKEGYHERTVLIESDPEGELLSYRLHSERTELEEVVRNARDRFYLGVAGFILSVPLTMYSYAKSNDYAFTYNSAVGTADTEELQRLQERSELWYTAYLGSLFLNGTFLVDTIIQMLNYIGTAQAQ